MSNYPIKRFVLLLIVTASVPLQAFAGDCRKVKFKFSNEMIAPVDVLRFINGSAVTTTELIPLAIKVTKIDIKGNDGDWTENIKNKKILYDNHYTTDRRRLNKLDSGKVGKFTVHYKRITRINSGAASVWGNFTHGPFSILCDDEKTIKFTLKI